MSVYQSTRVESPPATSSEWLTIGEVVKRFKVSIGCLRNATNSGRLKCFRLNADSFGGKSHRRFSEAHILEWLGLTAVKQGSSAGGVPDGSKPAVLICGRVSSAGQKEDLARQVQRLEDYAKERWGEDGCVIHRYVRTASGLNYNCRILNAMIRHIIAGRFNNGFLLITYRERLVRQGFDLIKTICESKGIQIIQTETEESKSLQDELIQDILSLAQIVNMKEYGRRGNKSRARFSEVPQATIDLITSLRGKGVAVREIYRQLQKDKKNICEDGKTTFSIAVVRRIARSVNEPISLALPSKPTTKTTGKASFSEWMKNHLRGCGGNRRVKRSAILAAYKADCEARGLQRVGRKLALNQLSSFIVGLGVQSECCGEGGIDRIYTGVNLIGEKRKAT